MIPTIEPLRLEALLLAGKPVDLIDVRTQKEFASAHVQKADDSLPSLDLLEKQSRPNRKRDSFVKPRAIALFSADGDLQNAAMTAVLGSRRGLRLASSVDEALRLLARDLSDLDMVIVDLDLDVHGVALLKALTFCCNRIPVVAIKSRKNIGPTKGAVACLDKPTTSKQLSAVIQQATTAPRKVSRESSAPRDCLGPGLWTDFPGEIALSA